MTIEVRISGVKAGEVLEMVYYLRGSGLAQGKDFDFAIWREDSDPFQVPFAVFSFYTEKYATVFALKYSEYVQR